MVVKQDPLIKPYILLGVIYFGLRWVSLAEYILILRVYSLLLQMTFYIRDSISIAPPSGWQRLDHGHDLYFSDLNAFAGCDQQTSICIWTRVYKSNYLLPRTLQHLFCNNDDSEVM